MTTPSQRPIDYAHVLPWTRLLRTFRIATDPRKLTLAACGLLVLWGGSRAIDALPFAPANAAPAPAPWNAVRPTLLIPRGAAATPYEAPVPRWLAIEARILRPLEPVFAVSSLPFAPRRTWSEVADLWTRLFWSLGVWALFGGAIARIAAVEFARAERPSLRDALAFSARRVVSVFSAPLLPLAGALCLWAVCALGGLVGRAPYAGGWLAAALWGLAVAAALLLTLILIATAAGWPLMTAAVAAEGSDAFDGFSRTFSYLYSRPWLFVGYAGVALLLGPLLVMVVDTIALTVATAAARMAEGGMGRSAVVGLHAAAPEYFRSTVSYPFASAGPVTGPARLASVWLAAVAMIAIGFATSYFWTAATVIYFLLRRADDATHFDEVWLGEQEEEDDLLRLAGIASTDQPVVERSHLPTAGPPAAVP